MDCSKNHWLTTYRHFSRRDTRLTEMIPHGETYPSSTADTSTSTMLFASTYLYQLNLVARYLSRSSCKTRASSEGRAPLRQPGTSVLGIPILPLLASSKDIRKSKSLLHMRCVYSTVSGTSLDSVRIGVRDIEDGFIDVAIALVIGRRISFDDRIDR